MKITHYYLANIRFINIRKGLFTSKIPMGIVVILMMIFSLACSGSAPAQKVETTVLRDLRENIFNAFESELLCDSLFMKYKDLEPNSVLTKGYLGGLFIAQSKFMKIFGKLQTYKKGVSLLEEAIGDDPGNLELIFLRLTIQLHLPAILGYNDNIEADKKRVLDNFTSARPLLKSRIVSFVKYSGFFTSEEKSIVEQ